MFEVHREEIEWGGRPLIIETGKVARQADGTIMLQYGETTVMAAVVASKTPKDGIDFLPLTVHYQEKYYAAGKIPGGFFKREARPSEKETLTARLIDRPIRPLFAKGYQNETLVMITVLSHDLENDPDVLGMIATSAALTISGIPFMGPIAGARIGYMDGEFILNPTIEEVAESDLDLIVAGTSDAVLMVESEAKELPEDVMLGAVMFGHKEFQPVIDAIIRLAEKSAKDAWDLPEEDTSGVKEVVAKQVSKALGEAYAIKTKTERQNRLAEVRAGAHEALGGDGDDAIPAGKIDAAFKSAEKSTVRGQILDDAIRIDGRGLADVRPIECEVGLLPRAHGSALFTRGETQALVITTLGTGDDEQFVDALEGTYKEPFLLHYNFPPYSVGEARRVGPPGRREIGHGKLAWRAVHPLLPSREDFPYTIRVVSEITESNGSSSMATVCGTSLAVMDAGVPLAKPVAGIAMGLIKEGDKFAVLSDILGDEDHLGDMDFKVAGTSDGITSLQMDIKIAGITEDIMQAALDQAKGGRIHILGEMAKALGTAREEVGEYAPRIETMNIPVDKIRDVIGAGGKIIREIVEETGAKIDISDDGTIKVASSDLASIKAAMDWIHGLTAEPEVGKIYKGKVVKTLDFGAFVNFFGPKDGLVHISQLSQERAEKVTDYVSEGDEIYVKLLGIDDRGKVRLSMKVVDQETGEEIGE